jgi:LPS sulfotransferase NodH
VAVSYLLCGTPRTASTLLCSLLASTGRLGRPESYFREPDEAVWAERFRLPTDGCRVRDYRGFVRAVQRVATTENGVFAARVMWGSMERLIEGLGPSPEESELATLERTFGRLRFVHLRRTDIAGQAVSWCRAEQTGFWQDGDVASRVPEEDLGRMIELVQTIRAHNAAWAAWFDRLGVQPHTVTYEQVVQDGRAAVGEIAAYLDVDLPTRWEPFCSHRRQADELNARWAATLRAVIDG